MSALTVGSLFSGIGGLELGLERAGMQTKWQVELDDYATKILERHWPTVTRYRDVRDVGGHNYYRRLQPVDVICGGFPCQDISLSGSGAGIDGARSGLWSEFARIICELRPRYAVVENVPALLGRGMGRVLGDLAALGYDAEWSVLSACALGAPHTRERLFIVAYPVQKRGASRVIGQNRNASTQRGTSRGGSTQGAAAPGGFDQVSGWWQAEPRVARVADGVSRRMDRLAALGNASTPSC